MTPTIVILGGGIGGLTAAHELAERGLDVEVYEKRSTFGGKARSVEVPHSAGEGRQPLPGEHGFRFFPAFYRHTFDTMRRIPFEDNEAGVFDNLVTTDQWLIAREGQTEVSIPLELPAMLEEWSEVFDILFGNPFGIPDDEREFFIDRLLTFLTSCQERREEEYERVPWWEFIDAESKSKAYQQFFGIGLTRSLVAMRAEDSSTRTVGRIYIQMLLGIAMPWLHADSVLDGPTSQVWIDPWVEYLDGLGVRFHPATTVEHIRVQGGEVAGVEVSTPDGSRTATGDAYVAALPVEVMTRLTTPELVEAAPSLAGLERLRTEWMNGIQFYLDTDTPITNGHVVYHAAPWALTSISQAQTWDLDLSEYGHGDVEDVLSVCISNWDRPGEVIGKPAVDCTPEEIKTEVWAQVTDRLNDDDEPELGESNVVTWFLDPAVEFPAPNEATNAEPLMINTVGSLQYRPEATTGADDLFLASDYVRTNTDLATMEAAVEAARRAVNGVLEAVESDAGRCAVWDLEEPAVFEPLKAYDRLRYNMGLPHQGLGSILGD